MTLLQLAPAALRSGTTPCPSRVQPFELSDGFDAGTLDFRLKGSATRVYSRGLVWVQFADCLSILDHVSEQLRVLYRDALQGLANHRVVRIGTTVDSYDCLDLRNLLHSEVMGASHPR